MSLKDRECSLKNLPHKYSTTSYNGIISCQHKIRDENRSYMMHCSSKIEHHEILNQQTEDMCGYVVLALNSYPVLPGVFSDWVQEPE